jgi:hypothetical protein
VDAWNRPRPSNDSGSASNAIGYLERHDTGVKDTVTFELRQSLKLAGPADHQFSVPVEAVSTTVSVDVQRDSNYGSGTKPTITVLANGEVGVTQTSTTDAGSASAWNTISVTVTPTAKGMLTVRLDSTGSAGNGNTYWGKVNVRAVTIEGGTVNFDFYLRGEPVNALVSDPGPFPIPANGGGSVVEEELILI